MCGIAGTIGLPCDETVQKAMAATLARRGPDDAGVYCGRGCCLIHTRLTIIDPEGGAQPMRMERAGERYTLVYNGELYNTSELRTELESLGHTFLGHSDTEVVLHACVEWGSGALTRFNGIFAFAFWEERRGSLLLARDRMGVKPLFYALHGSGLIFASEIKALLTYPGFRARLDAQGAAEILLLGPGRTPGCGVFKGVQEIEAGCFAEYVDGALRLRRYWKLTDREHRDSFEQTAETVRFLVTDAIRRQMVSDVPIGTFLSGGLDSSIISAVCAQELRKRGVRLPTFSVDYEDNEKYFSPTKFQPNADPYYIDRMQRALDSEHHWTVLKPEELVLSIGEATRARDLPGMADVDFSLLLFCREIRTQVKVALSGECADEIFGGYPWYRDPQVRAVDGFPWAQNTAQRCALLHPALAAQIDGEEYVRSRYRQTIDECDILPGTPPQERRMKEMVNLNQRWFMQTLLDRKDRMSMFHSLEVRVPFCDYRIAEYLYGVPWEFKDYRGEEKGLLRYAMRDLLPEEVLHRRKSPYPKTWHPRYLQLVGARMEQVLADKDAPLFSLVDRDALTALLHTQSPWPWYGQLMKTPQTMAYFLQVNEWLGAYQIAIV